MRHSTIADPHKAALIYRLLHKLADVGCNDRKALRTLTTQTRRGSVGCAWFVGRNIISGSNVRPLDRSSMYGAIIAPGAHVPSDDDFLQLRQHWPQHRRDGDDDLLRRHPKSQWPLCI